MDAPTPRRAPEWGAIHRLCLSETRRILGAGDRADDAAQEAIIRAWRHWDRRAHSDAVAAWVRTIARREAYRIAGRAPRETLAVFRVPGAGEDESRALLAAWGVEALGREVSIDESARRAVERA